MGVNPEWYWTEISKDIFTSVPVRCDGASIVQRINRLYDDAMYCMDSVSSETPEEQTCDPPPKFNYKENVLVLEIKWKNTSYLHTTFELDLNLKCLPSYSVVRKYKEKHVTD